jgi:Tfp pilus assembly protein FimT
MAVTVMGLMTAMAMPFAFKSIAHARLNNAARVVASDMQHAFSLANRRRHPIRVTVSALAKEYTIADRTTGAVYRRRRVGTDGDLKVSSITPSVTTMDIFPGGVGSGPLTVMLQSADHTRRVAITRAGQVRITP